MDSPIIQKESFIPLKVMSFNMKRNYFTMGKNHWNYRRALIEKMITNNEPDIIGTQELTERSLKDLEEILSGYAYIGTGRNGGTKGEYAAIFYKKDKFDVQEEETFWLSGTPQKPSRAWLAVFPRICTTCTLILKSNPNQKIRIFNTHLDHMSYLARINGLKLITRKMCEQNIESPAPVVLMGDFNATPTSKTLRNWYRELVLQTELSLNNLYQEQQQPDEVPIGRSYHGFKGNVAGNPIDYIFASKDFKVQEIQICRDKINERFPSDHYPVIANLRWKHS